MHRPHALLPWLLLLGCGAEGGGAEEAQLEPVVGPTAIEEAQRDSAKVWCAPKAAQGQLSRCEDTFPGLVVRGSTTTSGGAGNHSSFELRGGAALRETLVFADFPREVAPSTLYLVRGKISIDRRSCYLERERGRLWVGGDYDDRRGIYCGGITLEARGKTFADPGGAGSIYRAVNLLPDQLADYGYVANRRADWFPFQAEIVTRADERLITLRFKLKGPDLTARIDQLELRPLLEVAPPLSTTARPRQDELWLERPTVESARLVLGTAKHRWEISQSPPAITVRSLDGGTLGTVRFTTPILRGPAPTPVCTPHPRYASKKQQCQLSWGDLELAAFEDGNLILRTKVPTRFSVRGGGAPQRYAAFDLGTFFEASLDPGAPGGLLFQPEQERFAMSGLESQRVFTHRIPSKIGAAAPDQNGLFTFDSDRFLAIKARPGAYRVVSGPGASGALQVDYESVAGDRFVLTAFPQRYARRLDQQAFWPLVRVPVECDPLDALDAQGQIRSACAAKLDQLQNELGVRSLFFNNRTYARSVNAPVEFLMSRADPRKVIAPAELVPAVALSAVPSCASGVLSTNACRATVNDPFDLGGPWAPPPDREVKLRDFLRALRGRGLLSLAYSSPQFYFYGLDRYLADLRRLRSSEIGFDGVYLDGAPAEGAVVAGLEATRRIREAVGADGRIVFHLSSGTLPEDRAIRPVHLEPYADAIVVGEGSKAAWDLEPGAAPPRDCPPIWGLLYAGRLASGVPYALMPEVRPIDHARAGDFGSSAVPSWTLHPARQVEAQALCGGGIATLGTANRSFSFIDKFSPAARIMLGPGQPEAGECGYWSRLEHGGFCGP